MSHITRLRTIMKERRLLLLAMQEVGLSPEDTPPALGLVRAGYVTFHLDNGAYALVHDSDESRVVLPLLQRITQRYAYHVAREKLEAQGFALVDEVHQESGQVHLVMRRMA
jgi:hypothetical protein